MTGTPRSLSLGTGSSQTMVESGPTSWQCSVRYLGAAMWLEGDKRLQYAQCSHPNTAPSSKVHETGCSPNAPQATRLCTPIVTC